MRKDSNLLLANQLKMMQTNIQIFTSEIYGNIRTCLVNNQIMFVGKDVATALGYSNTSKAIQQHVDHEDKGILPIRETAYETRAVVINESGLYSLILSSKLPQAKAFKLLFLLLWDKGAREDISLFVLATCWRRTSISLTTVVYLRL